MKVLIIDLSRTDEIKILNVRIKNSVSVVSGFYLNLSDGDDQIHIAALKLKEEGLQELPAIIIPSGELVEKHLFHLPKMPDKDIKKVLPREIAGVKDSSVPVVFNYINNGAVEERQLERMEIAAFFSVKDRIFEFLKRLKAEGIKPIRVIPEAQGLKTLMEMNPGLGKERSGTVLLDLMANRISMNIFKNENWGLEREFMFRMETGGDLNEEDFTRISTELTRTFQYFKQRNRSFDIHQAVIYGSSSNTEHLKNLINDNLPVTASIIKTDYFQGKVSMPAHLRDAREFISMFALSIATAVSVSTKKYLDLLPDEYKEKSLLPSRLIGLGISAAIIAVILIGSTIHFQNIKGSYEKDIKNIEDTYLSLNKNAELMIKTKQQRADFYKRRYYIDFPLKYSYASANFVRRLTLITAPPVELVEIEINPATHSLTFILRGKIKSGNNIEAQSRFLDFYQELKKFQDIIYIESSNVNVNPGEPKSGKSGRAGKPGKSNAIDGENEEKQVELFFTINGELETLVE